MEKNLSASSGVSKFRSYRSNALKSSNPSASLPGDPAPSTAAKRVIRDTRETVTIAPFHDGYEWRKYGQKAIIGNPFPRCYYRCTYKEEQDCPARKQVQQQNNDDPPLFTVTYKHEHTCNNVNSTSSYQVMEQYHPNDQLPYKPFLLHFDSRYDTNQEQQNLQPPTMSSEKMASARAGDIRSEKRGDTLSPDLVEATSMELPGSAITFDAPGEQYNIFWGDCATPESLCFDTGCNMASVDPAMYCEPDQDEDIFYPLALW